jgi:hypothetical protein
MRIITNNPRIREAYPRVMWVDGGPLDVLGECRRLVHRGYALLAHPLMGDIHLLANPFRTVILGERGAEAHPLSVRWIEDSIEKARAARSGTEGARSAEDYQVVDFELAQVAMTSGGNPGISPHRQKGGSSN